MTEQVYANPINSNNNKSELASAALVSINEHQGEFKCKRIKILRILAIKTACLLNWNLLKFEKDIPVAVMSDLLHIFLKYTMKPDEEQTMHSHLEIDKLENYSIFALQLLHRWCLRITVTSRLLKRPPNKSTVINVYVVGSFVQSTVFFNRLEKKLGKFLEIWQARNCESPAAYEGR